MSTVTNNGLSNGHAGQSRTSIRITRIEAFKAAHWLETNYDRLKAMMPSQAAAELSAHIGKAIQKHTLSNLLKDIGREWPGLREKRAMSAQACGAMKGQKVKALAAQILAVGEWCQFLAKEYGATLPQVTGYDPVKLAQIAAGKPLKETE